MGASDRPLVGDTTAPAFGPDGALRFLLAQRGRVLDEGECREFVAGIAAACAWAGEPFDVRFAQAAVETNNARYGGQVHVRQKNIGGIGATDDGAAGLSNPDWATAGRVFVAHSLAWANDPRGVESPRHALVVKKAQRTGYARTFRDLGNGRWATDPVYGDTIDERHAQIAREGMATPKQATDRLIATLRARGRNVIDLRGKLPVNARAPYTQIAGGLGGIRVWAQHWTGDAFSRAALTKITGTDLGVDFFPENMAEQDEIDALVWYAALHIARDGGSWGGIAYGILVFPSGRIYVAWNLGTLTYHAFDVNAYSYAISAPASNGQAPTAQALVSLNHVWQLLCEETPEAPAGWGDLWGHTELRRFDARNQTVCPGAALLGHVQRARATQAPTVPLVAPGQPPAPEVPALSVRMFGDAIDFAARGGLRWEGAVDLSTPDFGGGAAEPLARYERLVVHRYNGQNYVMTDDLWDRLRREGKIVRWPNGETVALGDGW